MSIADDIFDLFTNEYSNYYGVPVNIIGVPVFSKYKIQSVRNTIHNYSKMGYLKKVGQQYVLTGKGEEYMKFRMAELQHFVSPFSASAKKDLIVMYDIPEEKRTEREWFRTHLKLFGYVMIQRSVWVGPSPLPKEFKLYAKSIGLDDCIKTFKLAKTYQNKHTRF